MRRLLIPLMLMFAGAPALAHPADGRGGEARMSARLGLDEAHAAQVRATFEKYRAESEPARKAMWQTRRALRDELAAPSPDQARVVQLTDELSGARQQLQAIRARRMAELKTELTPTQYERLVVGRRDFGRGFRHHGGKMPQLDRAPQE